MHYGPTQHKNTQIKQQQLLDPYLSQNHHTTNRAGVHLKDRNKSQNAKSISVGKQEITAMKVETL